MHPSIALFVASAAVALFSSPASLGLVVSAELQPASGHAMANNNNHRRHARRAESAGRMKRQSLNKRCKAESNAAQSASKTVSLTSSGIHVSSSAAASPTALVLKAEDDDSDDDDSSSEATSTVLVAPTTTDSSGGKSGTRWGLGWADGPYNNVLPRFWTGGKVSWYYNWRAQADDYLFYGKHEWITPAPKQFEYVPMLWSMDSGKVAQFWNQSNYWPQQGVKHLLGFNEPDQTAQSNIPSGRVAAKYWAQTLGNFKGKYRLVSPACTSAPMSWGWMGDFLSAGANPDVIAVHWYGIDFEGFANFTTGFHKAFNRPIWVTEIACNDFVNYRSCASVPGFMEKLSKFANDNTWIERIAWYGAMDLGKANGYGAVAKPNGLCRNQNCASGRSALGDQYFRGGN